MVNIRDLIILLKEEFPNNSIITIAKVRKLEKIIKVIHPKYHKHSKENTFWQLQIGRLAACTLSKNLKS